MSQMIPIMMSRGARSSMGGVVKYLLLFGVVGVALLAFILWARKSKVFKALTDVGKLGLGAVTGVLTTVVKGVDVGSKAVKSAGTGFGAMGKGFVEKVIKGKKTDFKAKAKILGMPSFIDTEAEMQTIMALKAFKASSGALPLSIQVMKWMSNFKTKNTEFYDYAVQQGLWGEPREVKRTAMVAGRKLDVAIKETKDVSPAVAERMEIIKYGMKKMAGMKTSKPMVSLGSAIARKTSYTPRIAGTMPYMSPKTVVVSKVIPKVAKPRVLTSAQRLQYLKSRGHMALYYKLGGK